MSTLKQRLTTNWHLMRIVRAGIGLMLLAVGIQNRDLVTGLFSVFFLYQAVTDTGCCGSRGCYTPPVRKRGTDPNTMNAEYEEIK